MSESQKKQSFLIIFVANIVGCLFLIFNDFAFQLAAFWFGLCTAVDLILTSTMEFMKEPDQKKVFRYGGIALFAATVIYITYFIFSKSS